MMQTVFILTHTGHPGLYFIILLAPRATLPFCDTPRLCKNSQTASRYAIWEMYYGQWYIRLYILIQTITYNKVKHDNMISSNGWLDFMPLYYLVSGESHDFRAWRSSWGSGKKGLKSQHDVDEKHPGALPTCSQEYIVNYVLLNI